MQQWYTYFDGCHGKDKVCLMICFYSKGKIDLLHWWPWTTTSLMASKPRCPEVMASNTIWGGERKLITPVMSGHVSSKGTWVQMGASPALANTLCSFTGLQLMTQLQATDIISTMCHGWQVLWHASVKLGLSPQMISTQPVIKYGRQREKIKKVLASLWRPIWLLLVLHEILTFFKKKLRQNNAFIKMYSGNTFQINRCLP